MGGTCSTYGGKKRCIQDFGGRREGRGHLGDPGVGGRVILKRILKKWGWGTWTGLSWLGIGTDGGLL
jgi:hypothetical protein